MTDQYKIELAHLISERQSEKSLSAFLGRIVIDSSPDPRRWPLVRRQWQEWLSSQYVPAVEDVIGMRPSDYEGPRSFWVTLPRGHDKTGLVGRLMLGAVAFGRRPIRMVVGAGDKDQARLIRDSMEKESDLNPWVSKRVQFRNYEVEGPGGKLEIVSSDAATSYGFNADLIVCEELTHWKNQDLWTALWSGRRKRPKSVYIVITNAGFIGTWQHEVVSMARADPDWFVYEAPGRLDTWMDEAAIERDRKMLPEVEARRLFDNQWVSQSANSIWTEEAWSKIESTRWELDSNWRVEIGCDVARFGDDSTSIHVRQGPCSLHHESLFGVSTATTSTKLKGLCERFHGQQNPKSVLVKIDETGVGGGVIDQAVDYNFVGINASSQPNDPSRYKSARDELWFAAVELAESGLIDLSRLTGDTRQTLRQQLYGPVYHFDTQSRRTVEPKKDTKKRLKRSPDDADAFNLAYLLVNQTPESVIGRIR